MTVTSCWICPIRQTEIRSDFFRFPTARLTKLLIEPAACMSLKILEVASRALAPTRFLQQPTDTKFFHVFHTSLLNGHTHSGCAHYLEHLIFQDLVICSRYKSNDGVLISKFQGPSKGHVAVLILVVN